MDERMVRSQEQALILIECIFVAYKVLCVISFSHRSKSPIKPSVIHSELYSLHVTELVYKSTSDFSVISLPNQMQRRLHRKEKSQLKPKGRRPFPQRAGGGVRVSVLQRQLGRKELGR